MDYIGFGLLAVGVAALQIMLDKGQEDDWFGSHFILLLAITAGVCLTALVIYEWFHKEPIVDVRLFKYGNLAVANMIMFTVGAVLFASTVLMPQFLQTLMGYTAEKAGLVLSVGAIVLLMELPFVGQLTTKVPARYLIAFGWLLLAIAMYYSTKRLDLQMSFWAAARLRIFQYAPLGFIFIPTNTAAYVGVPAEKNNAVAGLINFMRNIGSSVGTSMVTTIIARRSQFHQTQLGANIMPTNSRFEAAVSALASQLMKAGLTEYEAQRQALLRFYSQLQAQAATLSYIDAFWVLSIAAALMFCLSFLLEKNDPRKGGPVAAH